MVTAAMPERAQVRVQVPADLNVYARLRARAGGQWRGVLRDLGSHEMSVELLEGGRFDPPQAGEALVAELEHEGYKTVVEAAVARASSHAVGLRLRRSGAHDDEVDTGLLGLLAQLAARPLIHLGRRSGAAPLAGEHFVGAGHLDVRVQGPPAGFWQVTFLEHVVGWSEEEGLRTATAATTIAVDADALSLPPQTAPHPRPWRSLCKLAVHVAVHAAAAQPRHADLFALIQRTAKVGT